MFLLLYFMVIYYDCRSVIEETITSLLLYLFSFTIFIDFMVQRSLAHATLVMVQCKNKTTILTDIFFRNEKVGFRSNRMSI